MRLEVLRSGFKSGSGFTNTKSVSFDGVSKYVSLGEPADLKLTLNNTEFTCAAWIKPNGISTLNAIISKGKPGVAQITFLLGLNATGILYGYFNDTQNTVSNSNVVTNSAWQHVGMTVKNDGGGNYIGTLWRNGVKVTGVAGSGSDITVTSGDTTAGTNVLLGASGVGTVRQYAGDIDEVTFWNVGFSSTDWTNLYNSGKPNDPTTHAQASHLLHWYRMGDGDTYPTITDHKGSANGTMTNQSSGDIVSDTP